MIQQTELQWKNMRKDLYPKPYHLEQGCRNLSILFDKGVIPLQLGAIHPATDDMVKAGVKAGGVASQQLALFMLGCVSKEPCATALGEIVQKASEYLIEKMPNLINAGFPIAGAVISVILNLFWPDVAGPPPVTIEHVKDLIDKKVIEATDKLAQQLPALHCTPMHQLARCELHVWGSVVYASLGGGRPDDDHAINSTSMV
ncbi:hypothetical protein OEZ86_008619 [Tetradesmus obliquus]|nr:hypothetical protein OEZ86_008619 [Tetradesmus obliquus]